MTRDTGHPHFPNHSTSHVPQLPPLPLHQGNWAQQSTHELEGINPQPRPLTHELEGVQLPFPLTTHHARPTNLPALTPSTKPKTPQQDHQDQKARAQREARRRQIERDSLALPRPETFAGDKTPAPTQDYNADRVRSSIPQLRPHVHNRHKSAPASPPSPPPHSPDFVHADFLGPDSRQQTLATDLHLEPLTEQNEVLLLQATSRRQIHEVARNSREMPLTGFLGWVEETFPARGPAEMAVAGNRKKDNDRLPPVVNNVLRRLHACKMQHDPSAPHNLYGGQADGLLVSSAIFGVLQKAESALDAHLLELHHQTMYLSPQQFVTWAVLAYKSQRQSPAYLLDETERIETRAFSACEYFRNNSVHAEGGVMALCVETVIHLVKRHLEEMERERAQRARRRKDLFRRRCRRLVGIGSGSGPVVPEKDGPLRSADRLTFQHVRPGDLDRKA